MGRQIGLLISVLSAIPSVAIAGEDVFTRLGNCVSHSVSADSVQFQCEGGAAVRLRIVTSEIVWVRVSPDGSFPESLTVELGFVRDDWPACSFTAREVGDAVWFSTGGLKIKATRRPFRLSLFDAQDKLVWKESDATGMGYGPQGTELRVEMAPDEHFYGLGFQRQALDVRGARLTWKRAFRNAEATVGFFLSTRGYGFYTNNTFPHTFDFTEKESPPGHYAVTSAGGQLDYYLIHGPRFREILERYTDLTGRPWMVPRWALGLLYICRCYPDEAQVLAMAREFRRRDIPLDMIGLEPGWEKTWYKMDWKWHPQRFPKPEAMIAELAGMGLKMELWESGDAPKGGYLDAELRQRWYSERIEASLGKGVKFFKQDDPYPRMIHSTGMEAALYGDPLGASGRYLPAETENLANSLYSETAMSEARRVSGRRAMTVFNSYFASVAAHRWPFAWAGDFGAGAGLLNAGLSGHSIATLDMQNNSRTGLHKGFTNPVSIIDSWAYFREPWAYSESIEAMNRFYAKLKYRLIPYLYTTVHQAATLGLPTVRAMVLDHEDNPDLSVVDTQYMLGDWLLAGSEVDVSATRNLSAMDTFVPPAANAAHDSALLPSGTVYLPRGTWFDYWTGQRIRSDGGWLKTRWPDTVGGPLFVKGGAIIPMGQVAAFSEAEPLEVVVLDVYPAGDSQYMLYEDDGVSYEYEQGVCATTQFRCRQTDGAVSIDIQARRGNYRGMPKRRSYLLTIHTPAAPKAVRLGDQPLAHVADKDKLLQVASHHGWSFDAQQGVLWVKPGAGWRYDHDDRGPERDRDRDTVVWEDASTATGGPMALEIPLPTAAELQSRSKAVAGPAARLKVEAEYGKLLADGLSRANVAVTVLDAVGRTVEDANLVVELVARGEGAFADGGSSCSVRAEHGVARAIVASASKPGKIAIQASVAGLESGQTSVEVVEGRIHLKANPPREFQVGSWPPPAVTVFATVKAGDETLTSYQQFMQFRVTGPGKSTPAEGQARAVKGIATFGLSYEKPPKYTIHVAGPGLEPAQIPIY